MNRSLKKTTSRKSKPSLLSSALQQTSGVAVLNFAMERTVNFNHLMEKRTLIKTCAKEGHKECYWQPVATGRVTAGDHVCITMCCKHCEKREDVFLDATQYKVQERLISQEAEKCLTQ